MNNYLFRSPIHGIVILISFILLAGCDSGDNEAPPKPDNHIVVQGKKYAINDIILRSTGPGDLSYHDGVSEPTHYGFSLTFSDGQITMRNGPTATNSTYLISITFYTTLAGNTDKFTGGEFSALPPQDFFGGKAPASQSFFSVFFIRIDNNGDSVYDGAANDTFMDASIGTISSTGSGEEFTFTFNNTINDPDPHTPVTGRFEGTVELMFD